MSDIKIDLKNGFGKVFVDGNEVTGIKELKLISKAGELSQLELVVIANQTNATVQYANVNTVRDLLCDEKEWFEYGLLKGWVRIST